MPLPIKALIAKEKWCSTPPPPTPHPPLDARQRRVSSRDHVAHGYTSMKGEGPGPIFSYKLRYIVGFLLVSTNQKPTIYRNLYENMGPGVLDLLSRLQQSKMFLPVHS